MFQKHFIYKCKLFTFSLSNAKGISHLCFSDDSRNKGLQGGAITRAYCSVKKGHS